MIDNENTPEGRQGFAKKSAISLLSNRFVGKMGSRSLGDFASGSRIESYASA
jgi:hypothetical protein